MEKECYTQAEYDRARRYERGCGFWSGISRSFDVATICMFVGYILYVVAGTLGRLSVTWF